MVSKISKAKNLSLDLKINPIVLATKNIDYVFNLACNMGGMGFIENNKAECMLSVLINTNLLDASRANKVSNSLPLQHVYNGNKQNKTYKSLKERCLSCRSEDGYVGKILLEECVDIFMKIWSETRIADFCIYGI